MQVPGFTALNSALQTIYNLQKKNERAVERRWKKKQKKKTNQKKRKKQQKEDSEVNGKEGEEVEDEDKKRINKTWQKNITEQSSSIS